MRNSATVGEALRALLLHLHLHDRGAVPVLLEAGPSRVLLGYSAYGRAPGLQPHRSTTPPSPSATGRCRNSAAQRGCRRACSFHTCGPARTTPPLRCIFRTRLRFDAGSVRGRLRLVVDKQKYAGTDPALRGRLNRAIALAKEHAAMTFAEQVECALPRFVLNGATSADDVARFFGIHQRTLRKRLRSDGTHLQKLVDQTRFGLARQLLRDTGLPVLEIVCGPHCAIRTRTSFHERSATGLARVPGSGVIARVARLVPVEDTRPASHANHTQRNQRRRQLIDLSVGAGQVTWDRFPSWICAARSAYPPTDNRCTFRGPRRPARNDTCHRFKPFRGRSSPAPARSRCWRPRHGLGAGAAPLVAVGHVLPDVVMAGLNGPHKPLSSYRGRPLIINVWASWCGPCRTEAASLERLAWSGAGSRYTVIGISTDDDRNAALQWLRHSKPRSATTSTPGRVGRWSTCSAPRPSPSRYSSTRRSRRCEVSRRA